MTDLIDFKETMPLRQKQLCQLICVLFFSVAFSIQTSTPLLGETTGTTSEKQQITTTKQGTVTSNGKQQALLPDVFLKKLVKDIYDEWPDPENKKISAVLPFFRQSIENTNSFGIYLAETCSDILVKEHRLKVVSRSRLKTFIKELEFQQDELVQKSTRKSLGQFIGADYIFIGNFWFLGSGIKVSVRVYDVESAYALSAASVFIPSKYIPKDFLTEIEQQEAERKKTTEAKTILSISTIPINAIVTIEGIAIPQTKLGNMDVPPGDYLISVTAEGYIPSRETIIVEKSNHRVLAIKLTKEDKTSASNTAKESAGRQAFSGGVWSPSDTATSKAGNSTRQTKNDYKAYDNENVADDNRIYSFNITMYRKQYHHIKELEMTIDDVPVTNLHLINDIAHSNTLYKRTYRSTGELKDGHHKCNFAGKIKTGFFSSTFAKERWVTVNRRSSRVINIKLGAIKSN